MLHVCDQRFDVTGNLENFCKLNKTIIGVFIINIQVQPTQTIYIKTVMIESTSVLMAKATALALVARLNLQYINLLSVNNLCTSWMPEITSIRRIGGSNTSLVFLLTTQDKQTQDFQRHGGLRTR